MHASKWPGLPSAWAVAEGASQVAQCCTGGALPTDCLVLTDRHMREALLPHTAEAGVAESREIRMFCEVALIFKINVHHIDGLQVDLLCSIGSHISHQLKESLHPAKACLVLDSVRNENGCHLISGQIDLELLSCYLQLSHLVGFNAISFVEVRN